MAEYPQVQQEYLDGRIQVVEMLPERWRVLVDGEEVKRYDSMRLRTHPKYNRMIAGGKARAYARGLADAAEVLD